MLWCIYIHIHPGRCGSTNMSLFGHSGLGDGSYVMEPGSWASFARPLDGGALDNTPSMDLSEINDRDVVEQCLSVEHHLTYTTECKGTTSTYTINLSTWDEENVAIYTDISVKAKRGRPDTQSPSKITLRYDSYECASWSQAKIRELRLAKTPTTTELKGDLRCDPFGVDRRFAPRIAKSDRSIVVIVIPFEWVDRVWKSSNHRGC